VSKKTDAVKQLDGARADFATAEAKLKAILARELECTDTAAVFNAWRAERDAAVAEVDRLTKWWRA
jgi:hypothetical protein